MTTTRPTVATARAMLAVAESGGQSALLAPTEVLASQHLRSIVATLGPASSSPEVIRQLLVAGMDVARINASHGDQAGLAKIIAEVRLQARELGRTVAILFDL